MGNLGTQLKAQVRAQTQQQRFPRAVRTIEAFLDRDVPYKTGKLARSRKVTTRHTATTSTVTITYTDPKAELTDVGPRAHVIRPRRRKVLRFVVNGRVVFARRVMWRPGPGVARNRRWFRKNVAEDRWGNALRQAGLG